MAKRSPEKLLTLFESNQVVEFKDIQGALGNASRATCFRYLQQVPYHRSYNANGRYYTRKDPSRYDRFGLFSYGAILFSRDNTLGETIRRLVWESEAGWTQRELQDVLRVRVQVSCEAQSYVKLKSSFIDIAFILPPAWRFAPHNRDALPS